MIALGIALIALGVTAAYLITGRLIAIRMLPRAWAVARREWAWTEGTLSGSTAVRSSVKWITFLMIVAWPVYLTVIAVSRRLDAVVDGGDPKALAEKVARRDAQIAELERQLGIGPGSEGEALVVSPPRDDGTGRYG
jgi:hypothetical protein